MKVIADAKKASERFKKALKDLQQDKQECILKNNQHLFDRFYIHSLLCKPLSSQMGHNKNFGYSI